MGFDGRDAAWRCEADLPTAYRLGKISVACEGYDYPDDKYTYSHALFCFYLVQTLTYHSALTGSFWPAHAA